MVGFCVCNPQDLELGVVIFAKVWYFFYYYCYDWLMLMMLIKGVLGKEMRFNRTYLEK
jgi:hypothetical protein